MVISLSSQSHSKQVRYDKQVHIQLLRAKGVRIGYI